MLKPLDRSISIGAIILGFLILSMTFAFGQSEDIEGLYRISGANPGGTGKYRGEVAVARTGDVYQIAWTIGGGRHLGTGIMTDNILSVVY